MNSFEQDGHRPLSWVDNTRWLARRLGALDGRWRVPTQEETRTLGHSLEDACQQPNAEQELQHLLANMLALAGLARIQWKAKPNAHAMPMIGVSPTHGLILIHGHRSETQSWLVETATARLEQQSFPQDMRFCSLALSWREKLETGALGVFVNVLMQYRKPLVYFALASLVINVLALLTSLFSMQVYDRVIPSRGVETLVVLTVGVLGALSFDLVLKALRSLTMERVVVNADTELSHRIFDRLMRVRMDQFPASVGTLASQLRSYEMIRTFAYSVTTYVLIDTPFALLFLGLITLIGGPMLGAVPLTFFVISLALGVLFRRATDRHTFRSQATGNRKLGLLVEAVDSAETIKSHGLRWHFQNRWNALTHDNVEEERKVRRINEMSTFCVGTLQQVSYVLLVAAGAYLAATTTNLTSGGLIACSILSGRVLQPVTQLPALMMQWANAKWALKAIDAIFKLQLDHHETADPLSLTKVQGAFTLDHVQFAYPGQLQGIQIPALSVQPGEKIGIIGSIGSGKSTLLKLMAGLYKAEQGRVLIDHLDVQHISRSHLSQQVGLMSQNVKLFAGTLKENLTAGLPEISDEALIEACQQTGLYGVVRAHPKGVEMPISEGGGGMSGGQRQLIGITRLVLQRPSVWLLDEPTSSMDDATEKLALQLFANPASSHQTMLLVTHKPSVLPLVNRLIVMAGGRIVLDGPRDAVLDRLRAPAAQAPSASLAATVA